MRQNSDLTSTRYSLISRLQRVGNETKTVVPRLLSWSENELNGVSFLRYSRCVDGMTDVP